MHKLSLCNFTGIFCGIGQSERRINIVSSSIKRAGYGIINTFMEQTKNPFAQNVGEYILQIGFMEEAEDSIGDRMILLAKKRLVL